jgi:hypothetical protein
MFIKLNKFHNGKGLRDFSAEASSTKNNETSEWCYLLYTYKNNKANLN